jgi:hypothetical protein
MSFRSAHVTMDKGTIKQLIGNPKLIAGIHNYCDRWCERCSQTARCAVYAIEAHQGNRQDCDHSNEKFWQQLEKVLGVAMELLEKAAAQHGVDLDSLKDDSSSAEQSVEDGAGDNEEVCLAAKAYAEQAGDLLDSLRTWIEGDPCASESKEDQLATPQCWHEAVEVVRWYQHLIYVKLRRAYRSQMEQRDEVADASGDDSTLSAKVALICIDRSLAGWTQLCSHEDEIFDILVELDRLRRSIEMAFPAARACLRPGFEDIDRNSRKRQ